MKKSVSKRIRITKGGKMLHRGMGVNHFRTRKSGQQIRDTRKGQSLDYPTRRIVNY